MDKVYKYPSCGRETARCMTVGDFKGVGHVEAIFSLKDYVSRRYLWTVRWCYNFAAGIGQLFE